MVNDICLNCFKSRNNYDVCPHCGYVNGTPPEQEFHLHPGTVLNGRYLIGTVLGFGGFGVTYKAWDMKFNSIVAIKEFYPNGLVNRIPGEAEVQVFDGPEQSNYREYLERFLEEARNLAQFNGKANIVNVFGFFEENNTAYIVMEYLDGISLKDYIEENGRMPVDTALVVINELLNGVAEVHKKGILHRDIAPDNVILTNEGEVKILDFGSARFSSDNNEKTLSAFIKPGYAAPEQYAAQGEQGVWTDIYGLGATMYYMVTGIKPEESTDRMVNDTVQRPSELGIDLPIEVDKSIMKAMALQIAMRFKSTDEFIAAISGDYEIEYPEVEIKKRKRIRNIIAVLSAAGFISAIAFVVFLYNYFKVDPYTTIEPCNLDMWVCVETKEYDPGKSYMPDSFKEKLIENQNRQYENKKMAYEALASNFEEYMNKEYDGREIKVNMMVFDTKEGYDEALIDAASKDDLPDIFIADDKFNEISDKCMSLEEISAALGNADQNFIGSDNYAELYPSRKLIPLGFNAPVIYVNNSLVSDYNLFENPEEAKTEYVSLEELENLNSFSGKNVVTSASKGKEVVSRTWGIDKSAYNEFIALYSSKLTNPDSTISIEQSDKDLVNALKKDYDANQFNNSIDVADYFYFNQMSYLVGDTSIFEYVNNYLGGNFSVIPISNDGKHVVVLDTELAVSNKLNENEQIAARAFIEYLLSEDGQTFINVIIGASLPINKVVMSDYIENVNNNFTVLEDYTNNAEVIGENSEIDKTLGAQIYTNCYLGSENIEDNVTVKSNAEDGSTADSLG